MLYSIVPSAGFKEKRMFFTLEKWEWIRKIPRAECTNNGYPGIIFIK